MEDGSILTLTTHDLWNIVVDATGLDIESSEYATTGVSKAKRLRTFWTIENDSTVGKVLQALVQYATEKDLYASELNPILVSSCRAVVSRLLSQTPGEVGLGAPPNPSDNPTGQAVSSEAPRHPPPPAIPPPNEPMGQSQVELEIAVNYPDGEPVEDVMVSYTSPPPISMVAHMVFGKTGANGQVKKLFVVGSPRSTKDLFICSKTDRRDVKWRATREVALQGSTRLTTKHLSITIERVGSAMPEFEVKPTVWTALQKEPNGKYVASDLSELVDALRWGLPTASFSLIGKVLDGTLRVKGAQSWWSPAMNKLTLGPLLEDPIVKNAIVADMGEPYWDRLRNAVPVRNLSVHQHWSLLTMHEAYTAARVVLELLEKWFT